jgi:hypothetical protein
MKMTLLLWFALGAVLNEKVSDLGLQSAQAGWEYNESARPAKKKGLYPKAAPRAAPKPKVAESTAESEPAEAESPSRVQVFGKPAPEMSAEDYAKMMKEDAEQAGSGDTAEAVTAPTEVAEPAVDPEFDALRARLHTRNVAENATGDEKDFEPAPAPKKKETVKAHAKVAAPKANETPKASPKYIPPPPAMETEVVTPQKAAGKKVKGGNTSSAMEPEAARSDEVNAAFPYTHMLPSPFNIPRGSYVFGTSFAYGVFDSFELSTDVIRTLNQQWNFRAKVPLIEYPTFMASAFVDYNTFNAHHFDESNPDEWTKRWQPGLVTGFEITPDIAFFLGGNFNFGKTTQPVNTTTAYLHGAQANMEWSWLYNPSTSRLGNNAISLGISYDFTYSMFGFGFTHHWKAFDLGLHYVFADRTKFLPIFGFSAGF